MHELCSPAQSTARAALPEQRMSWQYSARKMASCYTLLCVLIERNHQILRPRTEVSHIASHHHIWPRDARQLSGNFFFVCLTHYRSLTCLLVFCWLTHFSLSTLKLFKKINNIHTSPPPHPPAYLVTTCAWESVKRVINWMWHPRGGSQ